MTTNKFIDHTAWFAKVLFGSVLLCVAFSALELKQMLGVFCLVWYYNIFIK